MDGHVLGTAFQDYEPGRETFSTGEGPSSTANAAGTLSRSEEKEIVQRLTDLGYL